MKASQWQVRAVQNKPVSVNDVRSPKHVEVCSVTKIYFCVNIIQAIMFTYVNLKVFWTCFESLLFIKKTSSVPFIVKLF